MTQNLRGRPLLLAICALAQFGCSKGGVGTVDPNSNDTPDPCVDVACGTDATCVEGVCVATTSCLCGGTCGSCDETTGNCQADATLCNGTCSACTGSGAVFNCAASAALCTGNCDTCAASSVESSCEELQVSGNPNPNVTGRYVHDGSSDGANRYKRDGLVGGLQYYLYRHTWEYEGSNTAWFLTTDESGYPENAAPWWYLYSSDLGTFDSGTARATGNPTADEASCTGGADTTAFNCTATAALCTGNCDSCTGSGTSFSCEANASLCTDGAACTGSGTSFSCEGGSVANCPEGAITSRCWCGSEVQSDRYCCSGLHQSASCSTTGRYYVSNLGSDSNSGSSPDAAWRNLSKVNSVTLAPGDAVLFKRGDSWFGTLAPRSGTVANRITYGAYGIGEKPLIHLAVSLNQTTDWVEESTNIWRDNGRLSSSGYTRDVGNVIINDSFAGVKKWNKVDLSAQRDFWYDAANRIYMYSVGNPASRYTDIKCALSMSIINQDGRGYINYRDLSLKYTGGFGLSGVTHDITASNLDIGWVGGMEHARPVRKGNGIEFWGSSHDNVVEDCTLWEIYDAALTNQNSDSAARQENIFYRNNIMWNCEYSFEYFNRPEDSSVTHNIVFDNNTCLNAGGGWGHAQRPDPSGYHLRLAGTPSDTTGFSIRNNIFDSATGAIYRVYGMGDMSRIDVDYNSYYQPTGAFAVGYDSFAAYETATGWDEHSPHGDPLLADPDGLDFSLSPESPCIDAGDPSSAVDPDGTRADIGALYFDQR